MLGRLIEVLEDASLDMLLSPSRAPRDCKCKLERDDADEANLDKDKDELDGGEDEDEDESSSDREEVEEDREEREQLVSDNLLMVKNYRGFYGGNYEALLLGWELNCSQLFLFQQIWVLEAPA